MNELTQKDLDRFWSKVDVRGPDECWEWTAYKIKNGYGRLGLGGKMALAHRMAWALEHGSWPEEGMCVCHNCDNPSCCNPGHLWTGTVEDNNHDRDDKGRQVSYCGEQHGRSKLTEADVNEIRTRYASGTVTQQALADEFGVGQSIISCIIRRENWGHI